MGDANIFPPREVMLICNGCGGERMVPEDVIARINSVEEFKRFTDTELRRWACRCCGAKTCDILMLLSEAGTDELKRREAAKEEAK